MVAAQSFDVSAADTKKLWLAQELAKLSDEERARYERDAFFRGCVQVTLEEEWNNPGGFERVAAAREAYGEDAEREVADLGAGRHPFQQRR
jgi:hypothetical protein